MNPTYSIAFNDRGNAFARKGQFDRALRDFDEAIRLNPAYYKAFNNRCWHRALAGGDLNAALKDCDQALRLKPNEINVLNSRGLVHFKLGAFKEAIADYAAAIRQNGRDADSLYGRGMAKIRTGDTAGGQGDIAAASAIKPDIAEVYAKYGMRP